MGRQRGQQDMIAWLFWPILISVTLYAAIAVLWCAGVVMMLAGLWYETVSSLRDRTRGPDDRH